jgi:hypothetical protein
VAAGEEVLLILMKVFAMRTLWDKIASADSPSYETVGENGESKFKELLLAIERHGVIFFH